MISNIIRHLKRSKLIIIFFCFGGIYQCSSIKNETSTNSDLHQFWSLEEPVKMNLDKQSELDQYSLDTIHEILLSPSTNPHTKYFFFCYLQNNKDGRIYDIIEKNIHSKEKINIQKDGFVQETFLVEAMIKYSLNLTWIQPTFLQDSLFNRVYFELELQ